MSKFDGGFANALTDDEYFLVMETIGIVPDIDAVLSIEDAKRKIDSWFQESPEREAMADK